MINTIDKQEALESIIEENLFTAPFMVELVGEEPEYDFDHDTRPDTDDARNRVMKSQILLEVKADEEAISKIEKDYNTYFNNLKDWAKPFEAEYYVDSILTTDNSITFVFDVPAQEDFWEPGKYLGNQDEDELAANGKEIYAQDTVKVSNKKHPLYDYEGKVLSFHGEGKGKHAEVLLSNGDTEIIKVSDLKDIDSYVLSLDKENLKELTETKLSSYCMDNATDKKNAIKAIDKADGISDRTKEKAKDILVLNESWCLDDSTDQKRFYSKVFGQKNSLHTNKYITGLNLSEYSTDAPDGVLMGFDSDAGEMVSYKGKLIFRSNLPDKIKVRKFKDGGELEEEDDDEESESEYSELVIKTIKKIAERNNGTLNYTLEKSGKKSIKTSLNFDFPTPEDKENFTREMSDLHNGVLKFNNGGKLTDNEDWKLSGFGGEYIDYKLGTIHKKDDGSFMVKYGVNEAPTGAETLEEAKSQLDKYTEDKIFYNKISEFNTWGLFPEDIRTIEEEGEFETTDRHWVLSKISDGEYEAVKDGLYMEVFKTLQDLVDRKNKIANYEYSKEKSEENGEETFVDSDGNEREYKSKYAANGSTIRADNSALLKYVNFEDNWHINLLELNTNRNQNGLKYKRNKYAVSRTSDKGKRKVYEFETLEKAENKFNDLVTESKTFSNVEKEGTTTNYNTLAANGKSIGDIHIKEISDMTGLTKEAIIKYQKDNSLTDNNMSSIMEGLGRKQLKAIDVVTAMSGDKGNEYSDLIIEFSKSGKAFSLKNISSYKKQLTEALEKKYNVNISDTGFDDTHIKLAMDKNESIDDVVSFIGSTYKLTAINQPSSSSSGKKSYICVIKDKAGNELGSYPVTHTDDKYLDDFLKAIGVKMRASDTRKIEEVEEEIEED